MSFSIAPSRFGYTKKGQLEEPNASERRLTEVLSQMYILHIGICPLFEMLTTGYQEEKVNVLGGRAKLRIVDSGWILHAHINTILTKPSLSKVVILKIEPSFRKPIMVQCIVERIHHVERVDKGSINVIPLCGVQSGIIGVIEDVALRGGAAITWDPVRFTVVASAR